MNKSTKSIYNMKLGIHKCYDDKQRRMRVSRGEVSLSREVDELKSRP